MKRRLMIWGAAWMLLFSACAPAEVPTPEAPPVEAVAENPPATEPDGTEIPCVHTDFPLVARQLSAASAPVLSGTLCGAILPHYAPAMQMGADLLAARETPPDTIVILAPNHAGDGAPVQICGASYVWDGGGMAGDPALAAALAEALSLSPDDRAAGEDWSASLHVPYLSAYFPEAQIVTILLSRGADAAALQTLGESLAALAAARELFVLSSVDFSHEQTPDTAARCDRETQRLLLDGEPSALLPLGNDYLDSPESAAVLMYYADACGLTLMLQDSHIEHFIEDGRQKTGSYYAYALIKADGDVPADGAGQAADDQSAPE
ncbi:MAG: AmmeMemoRadiSam system protein B [Ruminococcaceae bacterium]|nr:AmmeMemoRadiSam system protein B [Oscillospiraceae bacterium]